MRLQASRTWAFVVLVLMVLNFVWPRSVLPSLMVTPFLMGVCTVSLLGVTFRPVLPLWTGAWLAVTVAAIAAGPAPEPLALMALAAAAVCAWILVGLGQQFETTGRWLIWAMWAFAAGMALNALVAWIQFFDIERSLYPWVSQNDSNRPYGNLRQANHLATFSVFGLLAVWWLWRMGALSRRAVLLLAVLALSGVALSGSRTGLLELAALSVFWWIWRQPAARFERGVFLLAPVWVLLMMEAFRLLAPSLGMSVEAIYQRDSTSVRFTYWRQAWDLALLHPVTGVGWGNLGWSRLWELPFNPKVPNTIHAHNLVLQFLAETGFATTFLVLTPIAWMLIKRPPWRMANLNAQWAWMLITAVGLHSLLEYPLWYMNFMIPTAFAVGVLLSATKNITLPQPVLPRRLVTALGTLALVVGLLSLYDYMRVAKVFDDGYRASADLNKVASIQNTFLYRFYADRALVERVRPSAANAAEMLKVTDRMLNRGPIAMVFWVRLETLCRLGETLYAGETAALYARVFPASHAEFVQVNDRNALRACGLVSSESLPTP